MKDNREQDGTPSCFLCLPPPPFLPSLPSAIFFRSSWSPLLSFSSPEISFLFPLFQAELSAIEERRETFRQSATHRESGQAQKSAHLQQTVFGLKERAIDRGQKRREVKGRDKKKK
mmetsp:Transcript_8960/g.17484  ORF Transcript_8960/g.17484 Transcript_8960/m.17484 type:complete len:116 (-) Transcript_8960:2747-3094(-)